ncbi:forkhead box protein P1-B [Lampris incognitus]|uniref:forkhead box protein P1-B n=1 Tax=Lampris incognitus TaxID=2546036 RepID=UPI0024B4AEB4|nr:forkhead box protein P1-B [Lampris incognitus]
MLETGSERRRCGRQQQERIHSEGGGDQSEDLCACSSSLSGGKVSPQTSINPVMATSALLASSTQKGLLPQQVWREVEGKRQPGPSLHPQVKHRPSVLRQGSQASVLEASRQQFENGSPQPVPMCKTDRDCQQSSPPPSDPSARLHRSTLPSRRDSLEHNAAETKLQDSSGPPNTRGASVLFMSGFCRWPGCDAAFEDFHSFLKHLHSDHRPDEKSLSQWKVQQDVVQFTENQLALEKQKLFAMQLHLHHSEQESTELKAMSDWPYSVALFLPQVRTAGGNLMPHFNMIRTEEQNSYWSTGTVHLLPDLVPSMECYKHNNIRPPYTYAYLIRWSILDSPNQQCTLNEIYNWFTAMFYYFRNNTATWKNAVRHNLSLHKCFVRVEGGKGAVWKVDETEYQRRKGQKYYRDHPVNWLTSHSHFRPEEP